MSRNIKHWLDSARRGAECYLRHTGIERHQRQLCTEPVNVSALPEIERKAAWLADSILWTIEELEAHQPIYALRGFKQAHGYSGELWVMALADKTERVSTSALRDALVSLGNAFEDILAGEGYEVK